jgi:putative DNA primase/helicase
MKPATPYQQWICSPLHVEAVTFDGQDNNFGRELRFKTTTKRWRTWAMPMEMLAGDGAMLRAELLSMGVEIDPTATARNLLASYLQAKPPKRRKRCALQTGWNGDSFVLPDAVIGPNAEDVIFQSGECSHDEHTVGGTFEGWQSEIAARAVNNPMLALALSAAFAGPMLKPCNAESGGIHLYRQFIHRQDHGNRWRLFAWGGENFRRSWRATANGMEGAAARFNDCLLALDDISEADPKEVGAHHLCAGQRHRQTAGGPIRQCAGCHALPLHGAIQRRTHYCDHDGRGRAPGEGGPRGAFAGYSRLSGVSVFSMNFTAFPTVRHFPMQ